MKEITLTKNLVEEKLMLVIENQMNLARPESETELQNSFDDGGESIGIFTRDFGMEEWEWPQGVGLYGLRNVFEYNKDENILKFADEWYKNHLRKGLPPRNINTTAPLLGMVKFNEIFNNEEFYKVCLEWADWIINGLEKTPEGGFQHTTSARKGDTDIRLNDNEVWIDTLFMTVLFLGSMGVKEENQQWIDESIHQVLLHIKYLYSKENRLFFHGWSFNENNNFAGAFWCRGNSWFTCGIVEYIEILGDKLNGGVKEFLIDTYKAHVNRLVELQNESGLWNTLLDDKESYEEVSGSSAIAYGILKGIRIGILDESYMEYAEKTVMGIINNIDSEGTVLNVSAGTAMGYDREHYKNIIKAPMAYGQSLAIMALSEYLLRFM